jgi:peptidoglycan/LPS O-acetylase OafA/YrhL
MRCQSEAVAHHASTLAAARHAVNHVPSRETARSSDAVWWLAILFGLLSAAINLPIVEKPVQRLAAAPAPTGVSVVSAGPGADKYAHRMK